MPIVSRLFRAAADLGGAIRDRGLATPPEVARYDGLPYGADPKWQILDVYRPRFGAEEPLPVIVSVHGGAWVHGDKEWYQYYCMDLARRGFAVVNFTYHLLPAVPFEQVLEDVCLAFQWTVDNAGSYGFDLDRAFAVGDSAGAQILGLFLGMCTDPVYRLRYPFHPPEGFCPRGVALNCGIYELNRGLLDKLLVWELLPERGSPRELEQLSVLKRVNGRFPPVFLATCAGDFLEKQALPMAEALRQTQAPFLFRYYGERRLFHDFQLDVRSKAAQKCNEEEAAFFQALAERAGRFAGT